MVSVSCSLCVHGTLQGETAHPHNCKLTVVTSVYINASEMSRQNTPQTDSRGLLSAVKAGERTEIRTDGQMALQFHLLVSF